MQKLKLQFKIKNLYFLIVIFSLSSIIFSFCQAAELYLQPPRKTYEASDIFIVAVRLNTEGEYINTAKIDLSFDQDKLKVIDFSDGNSVLSLWMQKPNFSNQDGKLSFIGGVPAGYYGQGGLLGKVVFEAIASGKAEVQFQEDSQILLNDGFGTQAALKSQGAVFNILFEKSEIFKDEWQEILKADVIAPESFVITISKDSSLFEGKYVAIFSTNDKQTGVDYYEIKEGKGNWQKVVSPYALKDQKMKSIIQVRAVDKAGNQRMAEYKPEKILIPWLLMISIILIVIAASILIIWKRKIQN